MPQPCEASGSLWYGARPRTPRCCGCCCGVLIGLAPAPLSFPLYVSPSYLHGGVQALMTVEPSRWYPLGRACPVLIPLVACVPSEDSSLGISPPHRSVHRRVILVCPRMPSGLLQDSKFCQRGSATCRCLANIYVRGPKRRGSLPRREGDASTPRLRGSSSPHRESDGVKPQSFP